MKTFLKYVKIGMNALTAGLTLIACFLLLKSFYELTLSQPRCPDFGKLGCPSIGMSILYVLIGLVTLFFWTRMIYRNLFKRQSFPKHLLLLAMPFLMLVVFPVLFYLILFIDVKLGY